MSVRIMSMVFDANIPDLVYKKDGEERKAKASTVKLMLLAYADHANDDGEAAYPGYTRLERKTALSRQGIADTLNAIEQGDLMTMIGVSPRGTNSYKINVEKLKALAEAPVEKAPRVKPLDQPESSHLTSPSQATGLNPSLTIPKHPLGADAPQPKEQPQRKGDILDGMLHFAQQAADPKKALAGRVVEYPADVQPTLKALAELYNWPAAAIPARPRGKVGGAYAQWINELRQVRDIVAGVEAEALKASKKACERLSISHPGAILWCLPGEVGKIKSRKESDEQRTAVTPLAVHLDTFQPRQAVGR